MVTITELPLDLEGTSSTNRKSETHPLTSVNTSTNRVFVTNFGAFYTEGSILRDGTGRPLTRGVDYRFTYHYQILSELTGKDVNGIIVVINPAVVSPVTMEYNAVGGPYAISVEELKEVMLLIEHGDKTVYWEDIIGKPTAYVPEQHEDEYWQLYGLESTVENLDRLGDSLATSLTAMKSENTDFYNRYLVKAQEALDEYIARIEAHLNDKNNPHESNKQKIGLGFINNWPMATLVESTDVNNNTVYLSIGGAYSQVADIAVPLLNAHIADQDNPHDVTLDDLDMYSKAYVDNILSGKLRRIATAYDSALLSGRTYEQLRDDTRNGLDVSNVNPNTIMRQNRLADTTGITTEFEEYALGGDRRFKRISEMFNPHNDRRSSVFFAGSQSGNTGSINGALWAIRNSHTLYGTQIRPGALVIGMYKRNFLSSYGSPMLVMCEYRPTTSVPSDAVNWIQLI